MHAPMQSIVLSFVHYMIPRGPALMVIARFAPMPTVKLMCDEVCVRVCERCGDEMQEICFVEYLFALHMLVLRCVLLLSFLSLPSCCVLHRSCSAMRFQCIVSFTLPIGFLNATMCLLFVLYMSIDWSAPCAVLPFCCLTCSLANTR